ncbi:dCMP deaminase family protein [Candidatus Parcubacteria bacterium]|nr:dCMP deaminase family protein [Candidatus Parcubacteria bacterium]
MENKRPPKDLYYLEIAKAVSKRSPCLRRKYGSIIVKNDVIVSTGYNGPARGVVNCFEVGCIKDILNLPHGKSYEDCPAVHSEENAIINAARHGAEVFGGILYIAGEDEKGNLVEAMPCDRCKRAIINAGIEKVIILTSKSIPKEILVKDWIKEDSEKYLEKLKKTKK